MKIALITDTHWGARNDSVIFANYFSKFYDNVFFPYIDDHNIKTCIHLGVTCNLLPITGIPLPFVSYGGNAQLACICLFSLSVRLFYENSRPVLPQKEKKVISI